MKKLILMLIGMFVISCTSVKPIRNTDKYSFVKNDLFFENQKIGYVEAEKLQEKDDELRKEIVVVITNQVFLKDAKDIIYFMRKQHINSDIEIKHIF